MRQKSECDPAPQHLAPGFLSAVSRIRSSAIVSILQLFTECHILKVKNHNFDNGIFVRTDNVTRGTSSFLVESLAVLKANCWCVALLV